MFPWQMTKACLVEVTIACGSTCHILLATKLRNQKRRNPPHNSLNSPFLVIHTASVVDSFNLIRIIGSPRLILKLKTSQMQTLTDFAHGLLTHEAPALTMHNSQRDVCHHPCTMMLICLTTLHSCPNESKLDKYENHVIFC